MHVTIVWSAFGPEASTSFTHMIDGEPGLSDHLGLCERLFDVTNLQEESGDALWRLLEPALPKDRTHTSLSVGDRIVIDGHTYWCESVGWSREAPTTCRACRVAPLHSIRTVCPACWSRVTTLPYDDDENEYRLESVT